MRLSSCVPPAQTATAPPPPPPAGVRPTTLANAAAASAHSSALARYHPSLSDGELNVIRAALERLLPSVDAPGRRETQL